jgi:MFS family permease
MLPLTAPASARSADRARIAVAAIFLMHGILTGGWVPHIPLAKEALGVGIGVFGWILLAMAAGGIVAMPIAGALVNRFGSAALCRACGLMMIFGFILPVYASTPATLALALLLFGAAIGALDVAMNAHGVAVEGHLGRAVMSTFHGWFSVGAAIGAGLGGVIVGSVGETAHVLVTAGGVARDPLGSARLLLPSSVDKSASASHLAPPTRATFALGLLAFLALLIEGAMLDWSAFT